MKDIIGYKKIEENLWQNFLADKLHHCNLITGEKGNGKANFVKEFAKKIIFKDRDRKQEIESNPDILGKLRILLIYLAVFLKIKLLLSMPLII